MSYVTEAGFQKKTFEEIQNTLQIKFQAAFGPSIDLQPDGPAGQLIGLLSSALSDGWDAAQDIYTSRDVDQAVGAALDGIFAEIGIYRIDASATQVVGAHLTGLPGTTIPSGVKARKSTDASVAFVLQAPVSFSAAVIWGGEIVLDALTVGETYGITTQHAGVNHVCTSLDTKATIANDLMNQLDGLGAVKGVWSVDTAGTITWAGWSEATAITLVKATLTASSNIGTFLCEQTGAIAVPVGALDTKVTSVYGWNSIYNYTVGELGRDRETDSAFRIRGQGSFGIGRSTEDAIQTAILSHVPGITQCSVFSNRGMSTNSDGLPPKSFEAVVAGGNDLAVAQVIWEYMPAGIEPYGILGPFNVVDILGNTQAGIVRFSRAADLPIYIKVRRKKYTEEFYPLDGDALIKSNIVEWASTEYVMGRDVIPTRLSIPVYRVPGIDVVEISVSTDDITYSLLNSIAISGRQVAVAEASRITVLDW